MRRRGAGKLPEDEVKKAADCCGEFNECPGLAELLNCWEEVEPSEQEIIRVTASLLSRMETERPKKKAAAAPPLSRLLFAASAFAVALLLAVFTGLIPGWWDSLYYYSRDMGESGGLSAWVTLLGLIAAAPPLLLTVLPIRKTR